MICCDVTIVMRLIDGDEGDLCEFYSVVTRHKFAHSASGYVLCNMYSYI